MSYIRYCTGCGKRLIEGEEINGGFDRINGQRWKMLRYVCPMRGKVGGHSYEKILVYPSGKWVEKGGGEERGGWLGRLLGWGHDALANTIP